MREILQGTLFGFDLVLKVPKDFKDNDIVNKYTLEKHIETEKNYAVQLYKEEQLFKAMDIRAEKKYSMTRLQKFLFCKD